MALLKIVIDTNVVVSALFFGGKPQELLQLAITKAVESHVSPSIVGEYNEVIARITRKYPHKQGTFSIDNFISNCRLVFPSQKVEVCRDSDDNKFIECALEAQCMYIVSGDDDLLSLKQFRNIEIIRVADFFQRFRSHW